MGVGYGLHGHNLATNTEGGKINHRCWELQLMTELW